MDKLILRHCPFCGHLPNPDNYRDSIHPVTIDKTVWAAGCLTSEGGCDASVLGWTRDEAILHWNRRVGEYDSETLEHVSVGYVDMTSLTGASQ